MTDGKRVLWVSAKLPYPLMSGDKIRQFSLLSRLSHRYQIDLITFLERPADREFVPVLEKYCNRVVAVPLPQRRPLPLRALMALDPRRPFLVKRYCSASMWHAIRSATEEARYDIAHIEHVYMAPYFDAMAPSRRHARVLTLQNIESTLAARCRAVESNPLKRAYWALESRKLTTLERRRLLDVEAVVVTSEIDRDAALRTAPRGRVYTVENGVETSEYEVGPDEHRDRSVVFTGSLGYPPNADGVSFFLDEVWPLVRRAVPDAAFVIVGRDPGRRLLARHGREGITVTGPVADVRPYVARAGAVVVPLRAGGGTRLKILEAMATGAGIVSTRLGAEGLDVRPGRELLIADEPMTFARATIQLLTDGALRRRLGAAARRRAEERYDWRVAAAALDTVYRTAGETG